MALSSQFIKIFSPNTWAYANYYFKYIKRIFELSAQYLSSSL